MRRGFTLVELLIVMSLILIIAAIAIPNLLKSRVAANEAAAVGALRTLNVAEAMYSTANSAIGFVCSLESLGASGMIDEQFARGKKSGYIFTAGVCTAGDYQWKADPETPGKTGIRYFCPDSSGVIRYHPTSSATCLTAGQPL